MVIVASLTIVGWLLVMLIVSIISLVVIAKGSISDYKYRRRRRSIRIVK
ncbi:hypothetical protein SAMN05216225_101843 [Ornithinibacillus halophilus]|uniref:Uncharacterized protein n=1 Tax=Ornithinibacillus halophilus TaxID=930117 RepID=A0A1M5HM83_9BACI|nr:hypothetical protein SAMN05216225_101843 [Ornithinibacillus halophilus]